MTNYNSFRSQLTTDTAYNTTTETGAVLSDDGSALELDTQLSQLLTSSFASSGPVQSLADVGITVQSDGTLSFNQSQFDSAWAANPTAVQQMFTAAKTGVSAQFDTLINQLAGPTNSLLSARTSALQNEISDNQATITQMNQRLNDEQNLLYTEFYNMDLTIGKLKNTQSVISTITRLAPDFGARVRRRLTRTQVGSTSASVTSATTLTRPTTRKEPPMQSSMARDNYLFTEVNTATPQKLQLLLIEAALRSANRARQYWQQGRDDRGRRGVVARPGRAWPKCLPSSTTRPGAIWQDASRRSTSSSFARLVKAGHRRDEKSLGDAIRILEIERETWQKLCEKLAREGRQGSSDDARRRAGPPPLDNPDMLSLPGGFSVEA